MMSWGVETSKMLTNSDWRCMWKLEDCKIIGEIANLSGKWGRKFITSLKKLIYHSCLHIQEYLMYHNECVFAQILLLRRGSSLKIGRAQKHRKSMDLMEWIKIHEDIRGLSHYQTVEGALWCSGGTKQTWPLSKVRWNIYSTEYCAWTGPWRRSTLVLVFSNTNCLILLLWGRQVLCFCRRLIKRSRNTKPVVLKATKSSSLCWKRKERVRTLVKARSLEPQKRVTYRLVSFRLPRKW